MTLIEMFPTEKILKESGEHNIKKEAFKMIHSIKDYKSLSKEVIHKGMDEKHVIHCKNEKELTVKCLLEPQATVLFKCISQDHILPEIVKTLLEV